MSATHTHTGPHGRLWYVRRGNTVRGPFQTALVKRYLILGRLKQNDELSLDQELWQPVSSYPMYSPDRLAEDSAAVLAREDERKPVDRRHNEAPDNPHKERRSGVERRAQEAPEVVERRKRRARVVESLKPKRQSAMLPAIVATVLVGAVIIGGFLFEPDAGVSAPDCEATPAPRVNWSNCPKEEADLQGADMPGAIIRNARLTGANLSAANLNGSDLAYADFVSANMQGADLGGASLKGANLRKADLRGATLSAADLSYADLSDARMDNVVLADAKLDDAIWIDGRTCARGSTGTCQ